MIEIFKIQTNFDQILDRFFPKSCITFFLYRYRWDSVILSLLKQYSSTLPTLGILIQVFWGPQKHVLPHSVELYCICPHWFPFESQMDATFPRWQNDVVLY